jgi:hypothetical protein
MSAAQELRAAKLKAAFEITRALKELAEVCPMRDINVDISYFKEKPRSEPGPAVITSVVCDIVVSI